MSWTYLKEKTCEIIKAYYHWKAANTYKRNSRSSWAHSSRREGSSILFPVDRSDFASIGIIVSDRYLKSHRLGYAVNSRGRLFLVRPNSAVFVIPQFAPLSKVRRIDEILHQENNIPTRPDRIPLSPKVDADEFHDLLNDVAIRLHQFRIDTEKMSNELRRAEIDAYALLRHPDPSRTTSVFTPDAAKRLFQNDSPSYAQLYATHKLLADDKTHFVPDATRHIDTATFLVRAQREVTLHGQVTDWIRESSPEIQSFVEKSRKLITLSRSLPPQTVPTKVDIEIPSDLHFSTNDRIIIEFIINYVTGRRGYIANDTLALMPTLVKQTGMYPAQITANPDRNAAKLFLTEIGVWQPSESLPMLSNAGRSVNVIFEERPIADTFVDANAAIRHDFGEMAVYTIDDAGAHELDDGISIEQTGQEIWLHIHIANPSAFITPDSQIAQLARLRMTTLYLPDNVRPMLPIGNPDFTVNGFAKGLREMPTMTFSARLSEDGDIAAYKVRPGIVRNVKILTYDDVNDAIFPGAKTQRAAWWTPSYSRPDFKAMGKEFDNITPEIDSHLRTIDDTVQKHRDWRIRQGALRIKFPGSAIQVNPSPLPNPQSLLTPTYIRGHA